MCTARHSNSHIAHRYNSLDAHSHNSLLGRVSCMSNVTVRALTNTKPLKRIACAHHHGAVQSVSGCAAVDMPGEEHQANSTLSHVCEAMQTHHNPAVAADTLTQVLTLTPIHCGVLNHGHRLLLLPLRLHDRHAQRNEDWHRHRPGCDSTCRQARHVGTAGTLTASVRESNNWSSVSQAGSGASLGLGLAGTPRTRTAIPGDTHNRLQVRGAPTEGTTVVASGGVHSLSRTD